MLSVSRFHDLVKGIPRGVFDAAVSRHGADKHSKGFRCWDQLLAMLYAQCAGATSLREVVGGFNAHAAHHYHLGTRPVRRSTLAEANAKGREAVFLAVASALMSTASRSIRREVGSVLNVLDSTSITLKGGGFDAWTASTRTRHTQGVKLHVQMIADQALPVRAQITAANVNDISPAKDWPLQAGERYVFDKGYCDYGWWQRIADCGAVFVTRFKRNAQLQVVAERPVSADAAEAVLGDEEVVLSNTHPRGGHRNPCTVRLRRITIAREGRDRTAGAGDQRSAERSAADCGGIPGALAGRAAVQVDQAASEDQALSGRKRSCGTHPAADRVDRLSAGGHRASRRWLTRILVGVPDEPARQPVPAPENGKDPLPTDTGA